ncbi:hypothetical protein BD309DRAFT_697505 [Dichomitus squalens]|uniref:Uncharacterized protein n=1 Tax=Dichomitus squalens TaxID=114155 RepID=A0A4Q9NZV1_9APHY|nr:hypothetical protein BD309DRAFT_697505 [Dichomitus squalens]TBU62759.1 hypothetical protein BD310DRAFT_701919 [Dichomitus squalens]
MSSTASCIMSVAVPFADPLDACYPASRLEVRSYYLLNAILCTSPRACTPIVDFSDASTLSYYSSARCATASRDRLLRGLGSRRTGFPSSNHVSPTALCPPVFGPAHACRTPHHCHASAQATALSQRYRQEDKAHLLTHYSTLCVLAVGTVDQQGPTRAGPRFLRPGLNQISRSGSRIYAAHRVLTARADTGEQPPHLAARSPIPDTASCLHFHWHTRPQLAYGRCRLGTVLE